MGKKQKEKSKMKRQKMSTFQFEDLPDEVILLTLSFLEIKDLISCGHVSKRIRNISQDESMWQSMNLYSKNVPVEFLSMIIERGCKYLNLFKAEINGTELKLNKPSQLKYLNISRLAWWQFHSILGEIQFILTSKQTSSKDFLLSSKTVWNSHKNWAFSGFQNIHLILLKIIFLSKCQSRTTTSFNNIFNFNHS